MRLLLDPRFDIHSAMKIPTISELLDSPQLKPWVDKASRNVMVTSVKTFVIRMSNDLQSRAADMKVPSVGEWAERFAEWIARRQASAPHAQINATGILLPAQATQPIADDALHALSASLRDYVVDHSTGDAHVAGQRIVAELMKQLTGAEACLVTSSHSGAVLLALAATSGDKPAVIARGQVGELSPGVTLPQTARCAGVALRECGIVERTRIEEYEEALGGAGSILYVHGVRAGAGGDAAPAIAQVSALAARHQLPLVVELGLGGLVDPTRYGLIGIGHAADALAQGADLVIMAGDRILGGPSCGIVLGREAVIARLRKHGLFASLAASSLTLLPLATTLELHQDVETAERAIPLLSLLATSPENLKNRAERLAAQLVACPAVASAGVVEGTASLLPTSTPGQTLSAWEVVIEPKETSAAALAERLAAAAIPLAVRVNGDRLAINLRTVFPRHDMHIVDAFEGLSPAPAEDAPL